jgi:hypothetical protein
MHRLVDYESSRQQAASGPLTCADMGWRPAAQPDLGTYLA